VSYVYYHGELAMAFVKLDAHNYDSDKETIEGKGFQRVGESAKNYRQLGDASDGDSTGLEDILYKRGNTNTRVYLMKHTDRSPYVDSFTTYLLYMPTHYFNLIASEIQNPQEKKSADAASGEEQPITTAASDEVPTGNYPESASPADSTSASPARPTTQAESDSDVREAVAGWIQAFGAQDAAKLAGYYAPEVEQYFRKQNVPRSQIQKYLESSFGRMQDIRKYEIADIKTDVFNGSSRATATFNKQWETSQTDGKTFSGEEIERLTFAMTDEGWRIVREEELDIIRATRQ